MNPSLKIVIPLVWRDQSYVALGWKGFRSVPAQFGAGFRMDRNWIGWARKELTCHKITIRLGVE